MSIIKHLPMNSEIHAKVTEKYMDWRNSVNALSGQFFKLDAIFTTEIILKTLSVKNLVSISCDQYMSEEQTEEYLVIIEMWINLSKLDLSFSNEILMLKMLKVCEKLKKLWIIKIKYLTNLKTTREGRRKIIKFIKTNYSKSVFIKEIKTLSSKEKKINGDTKLEYNSKKYYSAYYL